MKQILFFMTLVLGALQGWATEVNPTSLQFSTDVGQTASQTIRIEFSDAEIPTDPNTPVVMSPSYGNPLQSIGQVSGDYSVSILGADSQMFSAENPLPLLSSNACYVTVSYNPTAKGTHQATLKVHCSSAGVVTPVSVNLTGVATTTDDDPFTHLPSGLGSVTTGKGTGLPEGFVLPGFNPDGIIMASPWSLILGAVPILRIKEVAESDSFFGVTVGSSATKTYEIRGHNFGILSEILNFFGISMKIRLSVSCTNFTPGAGGDALFEAEMFSVDPEFIDPWEIDLDEGGEMKRINLTYKPTTAGSHPYKIVASYYFFDANGFPVQDYYTYFPIIQVRGIILKFTSAVERHFTATANGPLTFNDVTVGEKRTCSIHVEGSNLNGPLSVELSPKNGMFSIDKESITANDAANGADINVTYEPTAAGSHVAIIKISGGGTLETTEFDFTGNCELPPPPIITVDQTPLNFGTVHLGDDPKTKTITVTGTNLTSDLNLSISGSMFTAQPNRISPADAAAGKAVEVTYKPTATGNHSATLHISGGGVENGPIDVNLSGKCLSDLEPSITATPSSWDFGTVGAGTANTHEFTITGTNLSGRISMVSQMETTGGEFTVSPESLPASGGKVTVTFKPTSAGSYGGVFTFGDGEVSTKITVEGKCATITATPSSWDFGTVAKNSTNTQSITVKGKNLTGDLTLTLTGSAMFTINNKRTITISKDEATSGKTVTVTYKPTAGGNHNGKITISGGSAANKTISLTGKCSDITATPSSWDFGTVGAGTTNTHEFTITGTDLSGRISMVSQMETIGGEFSVYPESLPATGGKVTVTFKPTSAGSYGGVFTFSDGQVSTKITVEGKCATITATPSSWDFGTVAKNSTNTETITVKGKNLTGNLTVSPESSSYFTVSPTTITAAQAQSANGAEVTVTYKPAARGNHSATFTISGGSATSKKINVTGTCAEITTNTTSLVFGGYNDSRTFTVKGYYLTGKLTLTSSNSIFTVTPSSITASQAANGVTVTVKCNAATTIQHATGKITISGGSAKPVNVNLTLDATSPQPYAPIVEPEGGNEDGNEVFINGGSLELYQNSATDVNELVMNSKIYAEGLNIIIESPVVQSAVISDISGRARSVNLQAGRNEIPVNASGIYIVRIREKTTKLMLK